VKFYVYSHEEVFQKFLYRLAMQFQIRVTDNRIITLFPDPRDGFIGRFQKLRDSTFFDLSSVTNRQIFPDITPLEADFFVVPIIIDSNNLQPRTFAPNPPPQASTLDLIACLPFYTPATAARHTFFFYGDQHTPPACVEQSQLYMVSCHRETPWEAMPYHNDNFVRSPKKISDAKLVYSFQGQTSVDVRRRLAETVSASKLPNRFVVNRCYFELAKPEERAHLLSTWRETIADSKFVLCPRGEGLSSIRLFETMSSGRVPVIIADDAKLPLEDKINYDDLIVRVPEDRLDLLESSMLEFEATHDLEKVSTQLSDIAEKYFHSQSLRNFLTASLENMKPSSNNLDHHFPSALQ
jgi:hypothetical protein